MEVTSATSSGYEATTIEMPEQELGKDDFLELLVAQLQNQDPLEPMSNEDLILNLSQFSTLEQTQNLNENFEAFLDQSNLGTGSSLLGKEVSFYDSENNYEVTSGTIDQVNVSNGETSLEINGLQVDMSLIISISNPTTT